MQTLRRCLVRLSLPVALLGCGSDPSGAAASTVASTTDAANEATSTAHVDYAVLIAEEDDSAGPTGVTLRRGWLTVAGLTAMPCTDITRAEPRGWGDRLLDALLPSAIAGHSEDGLPAWQVLGSKVVALHQPASHAYGLASESPADLCRLHLLLGRAETDAPSLAALPEEVTMARMTLHLELTLEGGSERTVRTDVGWGEVKDAAPALAAGDGSATVTLHPRAALLAAVAELDPATATEKDLGRAMLQALCAGSSVAYSAE